MSPGPLVHEVHAQAEGFVTGIDNLRLARIARLSGAPQVGGAGVDLYVQLGQPVQACQALYRLHARFEADLEFARRMAEADSGYRIGRAEDIPRDYYSGRTGLP
jgi:thymidine phosphorylase